MTKSAFQEEMMNGWKPLSIVGIYDSDWHAVAKHHRHPERNAAIVFLMPLLRGVSAKFGMVCDSQKFPNKPSAD